MHESKTRPLCKSCAANLATIAKLRGWVQAAAAKFREYQALHLAKRTDEGDMESATWKKAEVNGHFAEMLEGML